VSKWVPAHTAAIAIDLWFEKLRATCGLMSPVAPGPDVGRKTWDLDREVEACSLVSAREEGACACDCARSGYFVVRGVEVPGHCVAGCSLVHRRSPQRLVPPYVHCPDRWPWAQGQYRPEVVGTCVVAGGTNGQSVPCLWVASAVRRKTVRTCSRSCRMGSAKSGFRPKNPVLTKSRATGLMLGSSAFRLHCRTPQAVNSQAVDRWNAVWCSLQLNESMSRGQLVRCESVPGVLPFN
jgi:hypothetical protein